MKYLLLAAMLFIISRAEAQNPDFLKELTPVERSNVGRLDSNRIRNYTFTQQTLNYAALSYACPPGFDLGSPKKWYMLSADIIPQFIIGGKWMRFPIHITTRFKARILHENKAAGDTSLPVRTPSFMPGATIYFPLSYMDSKTNNIRYLSLSFFHHSNGQDGREFKTDGSVNRYNGNFSTNYVEPAFHFRNRKYLSLVPSKVCRDASADYSECYGRAGLEIHAGTADALKSSYGNTRLNLQWGYILVKNYCDAIHGHQVEESYYREKFRVVLNTTLIGGHRDRGLSSLEKRINAELNYYLRLPSSPNTSVFAGAGYYGSDPYNIYYQDSYFFFRAGLALGFFVAPKLIGSK